MPGTIIVTVLELMEVNSPSATISTSLRGETNMVLVKVAHRKRIYRTEPHAVEGSKGAVVFESTDFTFPVLNLRDNLRISVLDCEENEIGRTDIGSHSIIEKGIWDDLFPLEGRGTIHLKLQFILSDGERQRIQAMRAAALKMKELQFLSIVPEISVGNLPKASKEILDVDCGVTLTPQQLVSDAPLLFCQLQSVIPSAQVPSFLDNKKTEDSAVSDASADSESICAISEMDKSHLIKSEVATEPNLTKVKEMIQAFETTAVKEPKRVKRSTSEPQFRMFGLQAGAQYARKVDTVKYESSMIQKVSGISVVSASELLHEAALQPDLKDDRLLGASEQQNFLPLPTCGDMEHGGNLLIGHNDMVEALKSRAQSSDGSSTTTCKGISPDELTNMAELHMLDKQKEVGSPSRKEDMRVFTDGGEHSLPEFPEDEHQDGKIHYVVTSSLQSSDLSNHEITDNKQKLEPFEDLESLSPCGFSRKYEESLVTHFQNDNAHFESLTTYIMCDEIRYRCITTGSKQVKDLLGICMILDSHAAQKCSVESRTPVEFMVQNVMINGPLDPLNDNDKNSCSQMKPRIGNLMNALDLLDRFMRQAIRVAVVLSCGTVLFSIRRKLR